MKSRVINSSGICGTRKAISKNDEYYTHAYAVKPILKYIKPHSVIWCPFDTNKSNFVKILMLKGHKVISSHLDDGIDFFKTDIESDYIISNPPYTIKNDVLTRLFKLKKPFAMLMNAAGLFDSKYRFDLFKNNKFELMYMSKRVEYFTNYDNPIKSTKKSPPNPSVYFCSRVLPEQIIFEEIEKN